MPADLLVVTSLASTGEMIRREMEEAGLYRIHVVNNKASAIVRADEAGIPLAMLDMALGEEWVLDIGQALRTIRPGINLIIFADEKQELPAFDSLRPWILVRKPFDFTDFMTAISRPQPEPPINATLPWLSDVTRAAQHLTRLTLESSAQAALITRNNSLWAYAGGLSQGAAKEVALTVTRNWDGQKGSDLLRFIRLESTKAEHMLYATRLASDVILALVFDAETPFSTIRMQANQLVTDLGNEHSDEKPSSPMVKNEFERDGEAGNGDEDVPPISEILKNVPAPNPEPPSTRNFMLPHAPKKIDPNETRVSASLSDAAVFSREPSPSIQLGHVTTQDQSQELDVTAKSHAAPDKVEVTAPSQPKKRPVTPVAPPASNTDVTHESATTEASRKLVVEPTTAGLYHLTYACLLVPRFSSHYLTGDLADNLGEWLPKICIAFGWRMEFLAVRPEYLQWVVNVQPNTSPGHLMRTMRQQTSEMIFNEFPRLKKENPSGDFWAPGYLIMGGTQPHPQQLIRDYIRQTRQHQGQETPSQREK